MIADFTIRLYQGEKTCLSDLKEITISGITLIKKNFKHQRPFIVEGNLKKFGYELKVKGRFLDCGGSHQYPCISFKKEYIDIEVKNFPRYPAFLQDTSAAKSCLNGYGYINYINDGFPNWLKYRKIEILPLNPQPNESN